MTHIDDPFSGIALATNTAPMLFVSTINGVCYCQFVTDVQRSIRFKSLENAQSFAPVLSEIGGIELFPWEWSVRP